jgi:hypothetical protein
MAKLNNPKVFTDFHHQSLLQSFILLFEGRLGGEVYRPIGMEWFNKGYWKVYQHPATVEQFLGIGGATPDGTKKLNEVEKVIGDRIFYCHDIDSGRDNKAITYKGFMEMDFDIVIASLPDHIEPFYRLCQEHPNKPKLIYQVGNSWNYDGNAPVKNIMASTKMGGISVGLNTIEYHQEFDTSIFYPVAGPMPDKNIYSFVNCFGIDGLFAEDWNFFSEMERQMPGWNFKTFGGQCRDGAVGPVEVLADKMREARFIWHTKLGGDGYGHVIHNVPAVGRPLIVKKQYYEGKLAEALLIDGVTCITIDGLSYQQVIHKITHYSNPELYEQMCQSAYENFKAKVDFDREEQEIREFLERLV